METNLGHLNTSESLKQKIKDLKDKNEILESSMSYLSKLTDEFNVDYLSDEEISILNRQIEYHKRLKKIKTTYKKNINTITTSGKNTFSNLFSEMKKRKVSDEDLKDLKNILSLEQEKNEDNLFDSSPRDYVESAINVVGDFYINTIFETDIFSDFLDVFTVEYINFKEKESNKGFSFKESTKLIDSKIKALYLNEEQLSYILEKVKGKTSFKEKLKIEFRIIDESGFNTKIVNVNDIIDKQEVEPNNYLNITDTININDIQERSIENISYKKSDTSDYATYILETGINMEVQETGISLIFKMLNVDVNDLSETEKYKILNNLKIFIAFMTDMETDGKNVDNAIGSSAQGYFQYLTDNIAGDREKGNWNPFDSALRRCYMYYTGKKFPPTKKYITNNVPGWVKESYNDINYDLKNMSRENQTLLFLIDIFYKKGTTKYLKGVLLKGNGWAMRKLYENFHHTTSRLNYTNNDTELRTTKKIKKWMPKLQK